MATAARIKVSTREYQAWAIRFRFQHCTAAHRFKSTRITARQEKIDILEMFPIKVTLNYSYVSQRKNEVPGAIIDLSRESQFINTFNGTPP